MSNAPPAFGRGFHLKQQETKRDENQERNRRLQHNKAMLESLGQDPSRASNRQDRTLEEVEDHRLGDRQAGCNRHHHTAGPHHLV